MVVHDLMDLTVAMAGFSGVILGSLYYAVGGDTVREWVPVRIQNRKR
ncbi:MAG: hypothetical protein KDD25_00440 [Bdellovibrionales bacterium]|nr:hypothetical protein [Bdellovibrionales bacterium]